MKADFGVIRSSLFAVLGRKKDGDRIACGGRYLSEKGMFAKVAASGKCPKGSLTEGFVTESDWGVKLQAV